MVDKADVTAAQVADKALDKVETLITSAASTATDLFSAASNIISKGIAEHGEHAIQAVLWTVRIDALQTLVSGVMWLLIVMAILWGIYYRKTGNLWNWAVHYKDNEKRTDGSEYLFVVIPTVLAVIVSATLVFPKLTDVWVYTAVVKPELYLVKKTIAAVEKRISDSNKK